MKKSKKQTALKGTADNSTEYWKVLRGADVRGCRVDVLASEEEMAKSLETRFVDAGAGQVNTSYLAPLSSPPSRRGKTPQRRVMTFAPSSPRAEWDIPSVDDLHSVTPVYRATAPTGKDEEISSPLQTEEAEEANGLVAEAQPVDEKKTETNIAKKAEKPKKEKERAKRKQDFAYFKRTVNRRALCVGGLVGGCVALTAVGVTLLCLKLSALLLRPDLYFIFGGIVALVCGGIFYLCARHGDKKLAVKLDKVYRLGESVQTMVENKRAKSGIAQLQRENAEEKLAKVTRKKATVWHIAALALAPVFGLSVFIAGVAAPQRMVAGPLPEAERPSDIGKNQINELKKLIENVKTDEELLSLQGEPSAEGELPPITNGYVEALQTLLDVAQDYYDQKQAGGESWTNQQRIDAVTAAMQGVIDTTKPHISYREISSQLKGSEGVAFLGDAIYKSGKAYAVGKGYTYAFVRSQAGEVLENAVKTQLQKGSQELIDSFAELEYGQYSAQTLGYQTAVLQSLTGLTAEEDELLVAVDTLADNFGILSTLQVTENNLSQFDGYLRSYVVGAFETSAAEILYRQSYYSLMQEYICGTLRGTFDVEIPKDANDAGNDDEDGMNDNNGNQDDYQHNKFPDWPSDDLVVDVNGEKVHYGEILDEGNYAKILALLDIEGLPQEIRDYIVRYLAEIKTNQDSSND